MIKENLEIYVQYAVYVIVFLGVFFIFLYYVKRATTKSMSMYEEGIVLKKNKEKIFYKDIRTFYFIPKGDKKIRMLLVEKRDGEREIFKASHVSEDFFDCFQKDYMLVNVDAYIEKIEAGYAMIFGLLTGKQATFLRYIKTDSVVRGLTFEDEMQISRQGLLYKGVEYPWSMLKTEYDTSNSSIVLFDANGEKILETYFTYTEKGETAFNIMDHFILGEKMEQE